ncbi:phosphodiesterase [Paenibacillus sp. J31TS4]|uniref:HD-GYP domain-containing protein n=1 Tax=Paenibacillus sp. J31TS4 TaxID=2807195 RepID=UPI001B13AAA4|nr:HD-GYP domain-containing protein [Paenibacillus sp. J31TS4]GIP38276.1 phosphodiesterase [Paenibacillus sp. J31TS4]
MRFVPIQLCTEGMRLGKPILDEEGHVLLAKDVVLTEGLIGRLAGRGIPYLYIVDKATEDVDVPEMIRPETRLAATRTIRSHFSRMMGVSAQGKPAFATFIAKDFRDLLDSIIDDLGNHPSAMIMMNNLQVKDHYLFQHSLNVCVYSTMLGIAHGYGREELTQLGMGALLHDVGKTRIPLSLLSKPDKLTVEEYELMKKHAEYGFQLLRNEPNLSLLSAHCALQHHERLDGSGYPRGLKGTDIHDYARWIGIVDTYDALTTNRAYRAPVLPHLAVELLYAGAGTLFEPSKLETFRDHIAIYPLGLTVELSTGEVGVVVDLNRNLPHRPIVRILYDPEGRETTPYYETDLSKQLAVTIVSVTGRRDRLGVG